MNFALLGIDDATLALAQAVLGSRQQAITAICLANGQAFPEAHAALERLAPGVQHLAEWESLLDDRLCDAVLVARSGDENRRGEQVRQLVQAGRSLIVSHPLGDSMGGYEIDMARTESGCVLLAYLPDRWHPAVEQLAAWLQAADVSDQLGTIEQWIFDRPLTDRSRASVRAQFARDVDLIRALAGDVVRLAAFGPADVEQAYATLHVQMAASGAPAIRWSVVAADADTWARLSIVGSRGKAVLTMPADGGPWNLARSGEHPAEVTYSEWDPAEQMLARFELAVRREQPAPNWLDAVRSIELAETVDRSLRRGRAVELKIEETSEESNFKGAMAALGCGLLLVGMLVLFLVGMAHSLKGLIEWPARLLDQWPKLLLALLGCFLALQCLLLLTRRRGGQD